MSNKLLSLIADKKNQEFFAFAVIITLASFLRFYLLPFNAPLIGDQAKDYLVAYQMVENGQIPLLGIESSMPQFRQGPVYIWLLAVFFSFFGYDPYKTAYLAATIGLLAVGAIYIYTRKYFGRKVSLLAALILAASPLAAIHSQMAFIVNLIPLVSVMYLVSLIKYHRKSSMSLFWPALLFGLLFQFELASAPLIFLLFIAYKLKPSKKDVGRRVFPALQGLIVGLLPQIVFDLTHQFHQLGYFIAWVGYRIIGFFGYRAEHQFSPDKLTITFNAIFEFIHKFISWDNPTILIIAVMILGFGFFNWLKLKIKPFKPISFVWWWLIILILAYIIHSSPSEAYFPSFFVPISLALAWSINQIQNTLGRFCIVIGVCTVALTNSVLFTKSNGLTTIYKSASYPTQVWLPRLDVQDQAVELIKAKVSGPINIRSTDPGAKFPAYLDSYRYIALWKGMPQSPNGTDVWINRSIYQPQPTFINHSTYELNGLIVSIPLP